ncbi:helix-turn-helix domain-containing protein [Xanthobacter versatilis]|uniref:helix-turn-helix domain-containing protein n=1 Tax=Xanthobacter autotrophicus (strain ATCC BAA-1158 / Py2) TaxID=78245 RepID=UPI00372C8557
MSKRVNRKRDEIRAAEDLVIDAQLMIQRALNERGISRAQLARQLGVSQARLSQVMATDANPTLRTLAQILTTLGYKLTLKELALDAALPCPEEEMSTSVEEAGAIETKSADVWLDVGSEESVNVRRAAVDERLQPAWRVAINRRESVLDCYSNDNSKRTKTKERLAA